ncbi:peptidylprolyl isomerase [Massilia sp. Dwa41.01b]|uniref:peptidylprolyl isomerase n=1 Tax=unclassified Massilia TaxID=2609279 RepID=UPI0016046D97|nr:MULTISPECIES: peptidyl-prolyl cis-trans isomerase [unclassified Massilia]QNA89026.1 peptidylprolyl isomerase [Massilia sp. Dwa41.01b]QNA99914.1 peptidylprolyl isomerase [Massilia sp. Se16.2.3]
MMLKPTRLLLAMTVMLAAPVFAQNVATVNGKPIPASRLDQEVKRAVASGAEDSPQVRQAIKQDLISAEVLIQEAEKQKLATRPDVKSALENMRLKIMFDAMVSDFLKKNPVKDAEIKAAYDRIKAGAPEKEYRVRHILVENEADAKAIIAKLKGGARFEELAKQSKDKGSAAQGGDLGSPQSGGWVDVRPFAAEFNKALFALQKGAITDTPVKTEHGYHVIKLEDSRVPTLPPLEQVKRQLGEQVAQRKVAEFQQSLMKKAKIQ